MALSSPMERKGTELADGGHELWVCDVREDAMRPLLEASGTARCLAEGIG